jgi:hypothetical protein
MTRPPCPKTRLVDAHFAGRISAAEEAEMRRHLLEGCPTCHFRYTRLAMVAKVQPGAAPARERIAAGLGFKEGTRSWPMLFGLAAACAVLLIAFLVRRSDGDRFAARGPSVAGGEVRIFRIRPGAASEPVVDRIAASDELAFAYRNGTGKRHLFIFGVDEHQHAYWFSPAWRSASEVPAAPVAVGDGALHEIEDAIGHPYDGAKLDVYGLFSDRPWQVQELEAAVKAAPPGAAPSLDGVVVIQHLEVTR